MKKIILVSWAILSCTFYLPHLSGAADCSLAQYLQLEQQGLSNVEVARICSGEEAAREVERNPKTKDFIDALFPNGRASQGAAPATMCVFSPDAACHIQRGSVGDRCSCTATDGRVFYGTAR